MKGITSGNRCPSCKGLYSDDEYSFTEDLCFSCLYPQVSSKRPAEMSHDYGDARNETSERWMLDNLLKIPEKQSKASVKAYNKYKNKKLYKGDIS